MKHHVSIFYRRRETLLWSSILFVLSVIVCAAVLVPLLYLLGLSLVSGQELSSGQFFLLPKDVSFAAYQAAAGAGSSLLKAAAISVFRVVVGTVLSTLTTFMLGYGLAHRKLPGRIGFLLFVLMSAFLDAGTVPRYMVMRNLGLLDDIMVYILPNLTTAWCAIMMKEYIESVPAELLEAAQLDGAGTFCRMFRFVLPIAAPAVMAIAVFFAIEQWNAWFDAYLYVRDADLQPIQLALRNILASGTRIHRLVNMADIAPTLRPLSKSVQAAAVVLCSLPILILLPIVHRFFSKAYEKKKEGY